MHLRRALRLHLPVELAAKALKEHPEKSDRQIAAELGISQPTVSTARKAVDKNLSPEKASRSPGSQEATNNYRNFKYRTVVQDIHPKMILTRGGNMSLVFGAESDVL